jgi:hypothetical protein
MTSLPRIHLQPRDIAWLSELNEAALLDTETIHARHFPEDASMRACRRRLRLFRAQDLIQTIHINVVRTDRVGRMPAIHRLTQEGADLLEAETGVRPLRTARSDPPKPNTLLHRLGMAKVLLAMNDACKLHGLPKPEWILEYDSRPNFPPNAKLSERYILCREFPLPSGAVRRCWPDAACLLTIPHQGKNWRLAILWEYDRSTEGRSQLLEKVPGYESLLASAAWRQLFADMHGVRIFFVVPSRQRLAIVADALRDTSIEQHVRIGIATELQTTDLLISPIWITPASNARALLNHRTT